MASLPPQPSHQTTSPNHQRRLHAEPSPLDESTALSMTSEDSQTVLLDNPVSSGNGEQPTKASPPRPSPPSRSSTLGIRKCWICICDSTEDDPDNPPPWRSPCTCNLTAHETCLLDWVADLENPKSRRGGPPKKIQCPQCKSEIKIARPRSLVLTGVKAWERWIGTLTLPGMVGLLGGTIWAGCFHHGLHSVRVVFGEPQASLIYDRASRHWGWLPAYALVPLSLIAARTNYADFVLPGSTVFLFATQITDRFGIDWTIWPPRPSTVFGCLPVVRNGYNYLYEKAFGNLNRKWLKEIQPRQAQDGEDGNRNEADQANDAAGAANIAEGDVVLELNLEIGVEDGGDEEQQQQQQQHEARDGRGPPHPEAQLPDNAQEGVENGPPPAGEGARDNNPLANANPNPNPGENNNNNAPAPALLNRRPNEIISDTSSIFLNTLGALLFPSIAAGMGEILHHTLPLSWVCATPLATILSNNGREQLLRTRWGRSVLGGCLFVVLKDALVLYVRWRMAKNHRGRRIMDFDKTRKEYVLRE